MLGADEVMSECLSLLVRERDGVLRRGRERDVSLRRFIAHSAEGIDFVSQCPQVDTAVLKRRAPDVALNVENAEEQMLGADGGTPVRHGLFLRAGYGLARVVDKSLEHSSPASNVDAGIEGRASQAGQYA